MDTATKSFAVPVQRAFGAAFIIGGTMYAPIA